MTSEQITNVQSALTNASQSILGNFIDILPAVAIIVGALFVIKFVTYWIKKVKNGK